MKNWKVILALILFTISPNFSSDLYAQSLKIRAGGSVDFHLKQTETVGQHSPFESEVEYPSIGAFFDSNNGYFADMSFRFGNEATKKGQFFIGFKGEFSTLKSNSSQGKLILGEKLIQKKYSSYLGFGGYTDTSRYYVFMYGFAGFTYKSYKGEGKIPGNVDGQKADFIVDYKYTDATAFLLGFGVDLENIGNSPITIGFSLSADIGKIGREKSDVFYNGTKIGEVTPTGENSLYDNTIYISLSIGYQLNF